MASRIFIVMTLGTTLSVGGFVAAQQSAAAATCPGYESDPRNQVVGTDGSDVLYGSEGPDVICAGDGHDVVFALGGDDLVIAGGPKSGVDLDDFIYGGPGNDVLHAGDGQDTLSGWTGDDELYGEEGRDDLVGGLGTDLISGGTGGLPHPLEDIKPGAAPRERDLAAYQMDESGIPGPDQAESRSQPVMVTLDGIANDGEAGENDWIQSDVEGAEGSSGSDVIVGNGQPNEIYGLAGDDKLIGGGGQDDFVTGDSGNDLIDVYDADGPGDPSGGQSDRAISLGEADDRFACDFSPSNHDTPGRDVAIVDWDDVPQWGYALPDPRACEFIEPSVLRIPLIGRNAVLPVSCRGQRQCEGKITFWTHGQRMGRKFSFREGPKVRKLRLRLDSGLGRARLAARSHSSLRVSRGSAVGSARKHRVRLERR
jgi:hemolysin type calcium-binding protein